MNIKNSKKSTKNKQAKLLRQPSFILLVLVVLGSLALVGIVVVKAHSNASNPIEPETHKSTGTSTPPGKQEHTTTSTNGAKDSEQTNQPTSTKQAASVIIVDAGSYDDGVEVRAFVQNVLQSGTCTVTFTHGSLVVKKEVTAYTNVSSTVCTNLTVPRSEFSEAGDWKVKVSFQSDNYSGVSDEQTIKI